MSVELLLLTLWGGILSLAGQWISQIIKKLLRKGEEETIQDRVNRLTKSLEESVSLIGNIETEIKARSKLAKQLEEDINRYNKLVELKKPEVDAITQLLRGELAREGRSTFWKGVTINFLFFVLGAGATLFINMMMN
ncbi:MAG: hypothetical protein MI685_10815 [Chlorobiales bacterium]|nr:hypothetical protein [Chlorobiales bacterium]